MNTTKPIKGERIPGTNRWRGVVTYQGARIECPHRHASAHRARQCGDLPRLVREHRQQEGTTTMNTEELTAALIAQGVGYTVQEDAAFLAKDVRGEAVAHGAIKATAEALAIVLGVEPGDAMEAILVEADRQEARR